MIAVVTVVFGVAGLAVALVQAPTYSAEAVLSFRSANADRGLLETSPQGVDPSTQAAANAELVDRPAVARRVQRELGTRMSLGELQEAVTGRAETQTDLVVVEAQAGTARMAARLANEFARQAVAVATEDERARYMAAADSLERRLRTERPRGELARGTFEERIARLRALEDFAQPADVVRAAEVPGAPASPRPLLNTLLALLVGLTVGVVAAFLRDLLDRRVRDSSELEDLLDVPILAHVSDEALGRTPVDGKAGTEIPAPDLEAFRILRANLEFSSIDEPLCTIAVTSGLAEEGKSTVALSLAGVSAAAGQRTLLMECDLRRPAIAGRLGLDAGPGLTDHVVGRASREDVLRTVRLAEPGTASANGAYSSSEAPSFTLVTAGAEVPRPSDVLASQRFRDFLFEVAESYDTVVLDTAPVLPVVDTRELLPHVDSVLLCVRASQTTKTEAQAAKEVLERFRARPAGLVVTGATGEQPTYYGYYSNEGEKSAAQAPGRGAVGRIRARLGGSSSATPSTPANAGSKSG